MSNEEPDTVHLHRVMRAPVDRVYKAFTDQGALERWLPPYGFTGKIHDSVDARTGGGYQMSFTNFGTGSQHSFTVEYVELLPNKRIRHKDRFDDADLAGEMMIRRTTSFLTMVLTVNTVVPDARRWHISVTPRHLVG